MGLGLQPQWIQVGWGFGQPYLVRGVPARGRGGGTGWYLRSRPPQTVTKMAPMLQLRLVRSCSLGESKVATPVGPGLQSIWVQDYNPNASGIASQMGLRLQPVWVQDCSTDGSKTAAEMVPRL